MLFHLFTSQEERRNFGSSAFIEVQFCRMPVGTKLKNILAVGNIRHWQMDSLYIHDEALFFKEYRHILDCGIYNNLKSGVVDIFGINYYSPEKIDSIIKRLHTDRPVDYAVFADWLAKANDHNGFYILGI